MIIYYYRPGDDQFWIGCSTEEALRYFLPRMNKEGILSHLTLTQRNKENDRGGLFLEMYGINNIEDMPDAFFNVSRDLSVCFPEDPVFPVSGQWNGYNPFRECDHVRINDPEELMNIVMTLDGKTFDLLDWNDDSES